MALLTIIKTGTDDKKLFQCNACRHQTSLIAETVFQSAKLPLTTLFLAIYLISQAKTGLSALSLKRQLGVSQAQAQGRARVAVNQHSVGKPQDHLAMSYRSASSADSDFSSQADQAFDHY